MVKVTAIRVYTIIMSPSRGQSNQCRPAANELTTPMDTVPNVKKKVGHLPHTIRYVPLIWREGGEREREREREREKTNRYKSVM